MLQFDPVKDQINREKHGISLAAAADLEVLARTSDWRYSEPRYRAYGLIGGLAYCFAYTIRDGQLRAISLRRAHRKEIDRNVRHTD